MKNTLIRPPTLTTAVAEAIREAILRGELLPGEPLKEIEISKSLKTSRGTVREALRQLQQSGLVEVFPYRGAFVAVLSPQKAREIYTLRAVLEPYALRLALEKEAFSDRDFKKLEAMVTRLGELEEQEANYYEFIRTDISFHRLISERCGHSLVQDVLENLQALTQLFILNTKLYRSDKTPDELSHRAVFEGILTRDPEIAANVLRKHIIEAGTSLVERMEEAQAVEA